MTNINIGNKIRELRKKKGITQEALASVLSISPQAVSKWESGGSRNKRNHTTNSRLQSLCCIHLSRMI